MTTTHLLDAKVGDTLPTVTFGPTKSTSGLCTIYAPEADNDPGDEQSQLAFLWRAGFRMMPSRCGTAGGMRPW